MIGCVVYGLGGGCVVCGLVCSSGFSSGLFSVEVFGLVCSPAAGYVQGQMCLFVSLQCVGGVHSCWCAAGYSRVTGNDRG